MSQFCEDIIDDLARLARSFIESDKRLRFVDAAAAASLMCEKIREKWGGQPVYIRTAVDRDSQVNTGDLMLSDAANIAASIFSEFGVRKRVSVAAAEMLANLFRMELAGQSVYLRKLSDSSRAARYRQILNDFTGNNHSDVCMKYNISLQRLYQLLRTSRGKP